MDADILTAIATTRDAFKRCGLEAPTAILLGSHEEGMRFLSAIRQTSSWTAIVGSADLGHPVMMADGTAWMELQVVDLAIRWPATRYAMQDGSWRYA